MAETAQGCAFVPWFMLIAIGIAWIVGLAIAYTAGKWSAYDDGEAYGFGRWSSYQKLFSSFVWRCEKCKERAEKEAESK